MKRYSIKVSPYSSVGVTAEEDADGKWVKWEDVNKPTDKFKLLRQLNGEMYETLNRICSVVCEEGWDCDNCNVGFMQKVLRKVRGESE